MCLNTKKVRESTKIFERKLFAENVDELLHSQCIVSCNYNVVNVNVDVESDVSDDEDEEGSICDRVFEPRLEKELT